MIEDKKSENNKATMEKSLNNLHIKNYVEVNYTKSLKINLEANIKNKRFVKSL